MPSFKLDCFNSLILMTQFFLLDACFWGFSFSFKLIFHGIPTGLRISLERDVPLKYIIQSEGWWRTMLSEYSEDWRARSNKKPKWHLHRRFFEKPAICSPIPLCPALFYDEMRDVFDHRSRSKWGMLPLRNILPCESIQPLPILKSLLDAHSTIGFVVNTPTLP
jgi:hypothetical protein